MPAVAATVAYAQGAKFNMDYYLATHMSVQSRSQSALLSLPRYPVLSLHLAMENSYAQAGVFVRCWGKSLSTN